MRLFLRSFTALVILFFWVPLYAQDVSDDKSESGEIVQIGEIEWNIAQAENWKAGITREPALRKYYRLSSGDIFESREALEGKLEAVTRNLNSLQIYKGISYEIEYRQDDIFPFGSDDLLAKSDRTIAHVTVSVEDSFSLYLLPTFVYDSNLGLVFGGSFVYNNAFGTLTNLQIKGYGGEETWKVGSVWRNVPLGLFKTDWYLENEQLTTKRVDDNDKTVLEYTHLNASFSFELSVPVGNGFEFMMNPGIYYPYNYNLVSYEESYGREEFDNLDPYPAGFEKLGASYSDVFWEERFRRGFQADVIATGEGPGDAGQLTFSLDGSVSAFYRPFSFMGVAHNYSGFYVFNDETRENAGAYIRGVLDHLMYGDRGIFLNNNIDFRAFAIRPLFEVHLYPMLDLGYVYNNHTPYDPHDFRITAGFGITIFPLFLQSLQFNVEAGFDLEEPGANEITFKSELFF